MYNIGFVGDRGIVYYFRNLLNYWSVKGKVKNVYCVYKYLYYIILDVICCYLLLKELEQESFEDFIFLFDYFD